MVFNFVCFIIIGLSIAHAWNFSDLTLPIRDFLNKLIKFSYLKKPFLCPVCSSFWIGFFLSFIINPLLHIDLFILSNFFCGLIIYFASVITFPILNSDISFDKIDLKGRKLKTTFTDWNNFYANVKKTGKFNNFSVIKDGDELHVFFS